MSTNNPSLVVQRLDRATDISSSSGLPYKCLVFPVTGGVQAIDAAGNILPLVGPTGSLVPTADDEDDLGSAALRWGAGYFGTSVQTPLLNTQVGGLPTSVLALAAAASAVNIVTVTSAGIDATPSIAATGSSTNISLELLGKGTGNILLSNPTAIAPTAVTSGSQTALKVTGAANTGVATTAEAIDVYFNLARTVTWAAGVVPLQRAIAITAPAYAGATSITGAVTLDIEGPPTAIGPTTIGTALALRVQAGNVDFGGDLGVGSVLTVGGNIITTGSLALNAGGGGLITAGQGLTIQNTGATSLTLNSGATGTLQLGGSAETLIGFYGHAATAQQVLATGIATVDSIVLALQALGLVKQA